MTDLLEVKLKRGESVHKALSVQVKCGVCEFKVPEEVAGHEARSEKEI
jgi:hypothetical protein